MKSRGAANKYVRTNQSPVYDTHVLKILPGVRMGMSSRERSEQFFTIIIVWGEEGEDQQKFKAFGLCIPTQQTKRGDLKWDYKATDTMEKGKKAKVK